MNQLENHLPLMQRQRLLLPGTGTKVQGNGLPVTEQTAVIVVALLAGLLIASSNVGQTGGASMLVAYPYWIARIAIEAMFFVLIPRCPRAPPG